MSEPGPELPQFFLTGHFEDQLFVSYDSERRSLVPRVDWMEELVVMDAPYWDLLHRNAWKVEQILKWQLGMVMGQYDHSEGTSSHSLRYLFTVMSEPGPELPQFFLTGHFEDQLFVSYDSERRSLVPRVDWMEELVVMDAPYWDLLHRNAWKVEQILKWQLGMVMGHYDHSEGLHTLQWIFGCTLSEDGRKGGTNKFGYDGRKSLSFDKETLTWTANDAVSEAYKRKWEAEPGRTQLSKSYLEEKCISMLLRFLEAGKAAVEKRVAPEVKVTHKAGTGGLETLICHIHGFYPKEIDATWRKDGEVMEHETVRGTVVPNSDGTYNTWLSIEISMKDRNKYQCHVEHDSLVASALEEPRPVFRLWIIVGSILTVALAISITVILKTLGSQTPPATKAERQEMNR